MARVEQRNAVQRRPARDRTGQDRRAPPRGWKSRSEEEETDRQGRGQEQKRGQEQEHTEAGQQASKQARMRVTAGLQRDGAAQADGQVAAAVCVQAGAKRE